MGFFVICAGVILLQLSKSAKDVPDTAVFAGDLDQVRTIAEQEQPESEPKADAIRGAAAIVRRLSTARSKWEAEEAKRLHDEKKQDLEPIGENEHVEWDGLRRRRTTFGSGPSIRSRGGSTPFPPFETTIHTPQHHPPLGMSHFPSDSDSEHDEERPNTGGLGSSFFGSIRTRAKSMIGPGNSRSPGPHAQSPMHPVPLTEINIPSYKEQFDGSGAPYYGHEAEGTDHTFGLPFGIRDHKTEYEGAAGEHRERHITIADDPDRIGSRGSSLHPDSVGPTPPPHSARRQFSFQNVFRKGQAHAQPDEHVAQSRSSIIRKGLGPRKGSHGSATKGATEEEQLGLVKGDTATGRRPTLPPYEDEEEEEQKEDWLGEDKVPQERGFRRELTPPRTQNRGKERVIEKEIEAGPTMVDSEEEEEVIHEKQRKKLTKKPRGGSQPPKPPPHDDPRLGGAGGGNAASGAFI